VNETEINDALQVVDCAPVFVNRDRLSHQVKHEYELRHCAPRGMRHNFGCD
jgi:hypothetical protein